MGLIAWYPLNGTGESKGLITNKFSIGASEYGDGGKIGKYYLTSNGRRGSGSISGIESLKQVSIAFWFKENKIETTAWQDFMKFYAYYDDGETTKGGEFRLEQHTSSDKTQVYADWYCTTTSTSYPSSTWAASYSNSPQITDLGWHHTVLMLDFVNHKCTSYFDGILNKTMDINTNAKYITGALYIGDDNIDAGVCDLRLYDNLLSAQEIKDLNNCLILHYPLGNGYGNENLIEEGNLASSWVEEGCTRENVVDSSKGNCLKVIGKNGNKRIYRAVKNVWTTNNQKYQVSFWAKTDTENCQINFSRSMTDYTKDFTLTSNWNYYIGIITTTGINSSGTLSLTVKTTDGVVYIKDIKLQEGTAQMIYSPNSADALYKTLGYDTTTEYDTSGFGNNGTKFGTITSSSDSPIGNSSYYIPSTAYINTNSAIHTYNQITMSIWFKGANGCHFGNWESGGCGLWTESNKWKATVYANSKYNDITGGALQDGWHFAAMTYDGQVIRIYNDGVETGKLDLGSKYTIQWHTTAPWTINGNPNATGSSVDQRVTGYWADARLYATALTADDIKQLYQTKTRVDKNGNLYSSQFIETDSERNLLTIDQYPTSFSGFGSYDKELVDCSDSVTGKATKITCTVAGNGFYIGGFNVFDKTHLVNGKQYMISLYAKSDNRTSVTFNVESSSKMFKSTFAIGTEYRRICIIYTYSNTQTYSAFTCYSGWKVDENIYIHSLKVTEYNPEVHFKDDSVVEANSFIEINSEEKTKIYKQDIQTNQIIEN